MKVNIFNPEWNECEVNKFFSILNERGKKAHPYNTFNKYIQIDKKIYTSSCGKSSLYSILNLNGIDENAEVILPCYCCDSVAYPARYLNAKVILADIDTSDLNISLDSIKELVTPKTKVIIVPSIYGNAANISEIRANVAKNILVINDLAQGYGIKLNGFPIESYGDAGFISCGPGKQLAGACGSVYWLNGNIAPVNLKKQNKLINKLIHKLFYYTRVNIDDTIGSPFYKAASIIYFIINQKRYFVNRSATSLDMETMLMLIENYQNKLEDKRNFISEIDTISTNRSYRLIKAERGKSSPIKIPLIFNSVDACNSAKKVLKTNGIYYSTGYSKIKGVERETLSGYNQIAGKIIEIPLELRKKNHILNAINQID